MADYTSYDENRYATSASIIFNIYGQLYFETNTMQQYEFVSLKKQAYFDLCIFIYASRRVEILFLVTLLMLYTSVIINI